MVYVIAWRRLGEPFPVFSPPLNSRFSMSFPGVDLGRFPGVLVLEARGDPAIQINMPG